MLRKVSAQQRDGRKGCFPIVRYLLWLDKRYEVGVRFVLFYFAVAQGGEALRQHETGRRHRGFLERRDDGE